MGSKYGHMAGAIVRIVVFSVAVGLITLFLVSLNSKDGPRVAGALAAAAGTVCALLAAWSLRPPPEHPGGGAGTTPRAMPWHRVALIVGVVVCVAAVLVYWFVIHKTDLPVTDRMAVGPSGQGLRTNKVVTLPVYGTPPPRRNLALTLQVVNEDAAGDCESPARLYVDPVVDGVTRPRVTARSRREVKVRLSAARTALLRITLHERDPACTVDLHVTEATLYN